MAQHTISIGLIQDDPERPSQTAARDALTSTAQSLNMQISIASIPTPELEKDADLVLAPYAALYAPGGIFRSLDGAIEGVRFARGRTRPFLGTCAGFQAAALEYARNVIGISDAQHAEYQPSAPNPFISPLCCSVAGQTMPVEIATDSKVFAYYGKARINEHYRCTFGMSRKTSN